MLIRLRILRGYILRCFLLEVKGAVEDAIHLVLALMLYEKTSRRIFPARHVGFLVLDNGQTT
jgi:hypothetical protein